MSEWFVLNSAKRSACSLQAADMIRILRASTSQLCELPQFDLRSIVESELSLKFTGDQLTYEVHPVVPYENVYEHSCPIGKPSHAAFIAEFESRVVGRIDLSVNWNGLGYIHNLAVDRLFQRRAVATNLVQKALAWSQTEQLPGVMLETQHNNVPACKLYERCGFQLSGFDKNLYRGLAPHARDVAVFWYWWAIEGHGPSPQNSV